MRVSLRVIWMHVRIATATELAYRSNFWTYLLTTAVTLATTLAGLSIVFGHVESLGGWSSDELLVVIGSWFMALALIMGIVHRSMAELVEDIRKGDFDYRLLRPVDPQLVAIAQRVDPWRLFDAVIGTTLIVVGMLRTDSGAAPNEVAGHVVAGLAMLACAAVIVAAFWTLLASVTFWTVQGEGILWALDDMCEHLRWPIGIFPRALRIALMTVFPIGLAVTVPAEALTGRLDLEGALAAVAIATILTIASRSVWNVAIRRYEGASA